MKEEEIPDRNIFMMCESLNRNALTELPVGYSLRNCRHEELGIWKMMPFDRPDLAKEYDGFMTDYFTVTYGGKEELGHQFHCNTKAVKTIQSSIVSIVRLLNEIDWVSSN